MNAPAHLARPGRGPPGNVRELPLWDRLSRAEDETGFYAIWIEIQAGQIAHAVQASLLIVDPQAGGGKNQRYFWPDAEGSAELDTVIESAIARGKGVVVKAPDQAVPSDKSLMHAAFPALVDGEVRAVAAVAFRSRGPGSILAATNALQWGAAWLRERALVDEKATRRQTQALASTVLTYLAVALDERSLANAARAVVTHIAEDLSCERVSLGLFGKRTPKVLAISHTAHFGKKMNLVGALSASMAEAADQAQTIQLLGHEEISNRDGFGQERSFVVTKAHEELIRLHASGTVLTIPMMLDGEPFAAITLERGTGHAFDQRDVEILEVFAAAFAPVMRDRKAGERPVVKRAFDRLVAFMGKLWGPEEAIVKFSAAGLIALAVLFTFWHGDHEVVADAIVEGREQRAISAGFDGFLVDAPVRAGDRIEEGDLLAALDDRDLSLELIRWQAERRQHQIAYERALADGDRVELRIAESLSEQAAARIDLLNDRLSRLRLVAPFDGIVVAGDHSQRIGASVQRGEVLFELAPNDGLRVMLEVPETDIADIEAGLPGRLVVSALPESRFDIAVERITPLGQVVDGRNVFEVEARLAGDNADQALRPGLEGAARIEVGRARVIWIWTHALHDWLRLTLWRWF